MNLSIIIVTYNSAAEIVACLSSIEASKLEHAEVIVVDNNSNDDTVSLVNHAFPEIRTIANGENRGFAAGCNQGVAFSTGDYILLLNPDTEVKPHAIRALMGSYALFPDAGIVGPRLVYPDGRIQAACARRLPSLLTYTYELFYLSRLLSVMHVAWPGGYKVGRKIVAVQAVCGAALCFPRSLISRIGPLDERLPMGAEDIDFCARARDAGVSVYCNPSSTIVHMEWASMRQQRWQSQIRYSKVALSFIETHHGRPYALTARLLFASGFLFRAAINALALPFDPRNCYFRLRACLVLWLWCLTHRRA